MKKNILAIISMTIFIFSFHHCWYSDQLQNSLFLLNLIPSVILSIAWFTCFVISLKELIKKKTAINILTHVIVIINALIVLFFPFREAKVRLELSLYEEERLEIIKMITDKQLESDDLGHVILPDKYKKISTGGTVFVYQNDDKGTVICFWIMRGLLSGSVELIYSTGGEHLIKENEDGHPIVSIDKLKDNWYYVVTDY